MKMKHVDLRPWREAMEKSLREHAENELQLIAAIDKYEAYPEHDKTEKRLAKEAATTAIQLLHWHQRNLLDSAVIRQRIEDGVARIMQRVTLAGVRQGVTPLDYFTTKKTPSIGRQFESHHKIRFEYLTAFECWLLPEEIDYALISQVARDGKSREVAPRSKWPKTLEQCEGVLLRYVKEQHGLDLYSDGGTYRDVGATYENALRKYVRASLEHMSGAHKPLPWMEPDTEVSW